MIPRLLAVSALIVPSFLAQQESSAPTTQSILEHTKAATAMVLAGEGAGRLHSIATAVIISKNGVMLTALHAVKGAAEVQVRLANGDVFDHVELLGTDERRDIAALKIPASGLTSVVPQTSTALTAGDHIYAVTNSGALSWSANEGMISAIRPADEVPGAGTGFRLIQFSASVAPGSSGGALVNRNGELLGIITRGSNGTAFAVPVESVLGLPEAGPHIALGSGASLQMPASQQVATPQSSAAIAGSNPKQIAKDAKTIFIMSKTAFLTVDTLDRALMQEKDWSKLGLTIVHDQRVADLLIEIDRPLFTYVHTFVVIDKKTSIVLDSGKVTAFDGTIASGGIAKDLVKFFATTHLPAEHKN